MLQVKITIDMLSKRPAAIYSTLAIVLKIMCFEFFTLLNYSFENCFLHKERNHLSRLTRHELRVMVINMSV